jgi:hypothetical protein
MQALDVRGFIEKVDYLSTVSGGGYIGASMTASMNTGTNGTFPFPSELRTGESAGLQHIRDHSNYLFPQGFLNIFGNLVVYLRGIVANVVLLLPWLLLAAALTIFFNPNVDSLARSKIAGTYDLPAHHFGVALAGFLIFGILLAVWAYWRSAPWGVGASDVGVATRFFGILLLILLGVTFVELQPVLLLALFKITTSPGGASGLLVDAHSFLKALSAFFASIGIVVGFLGRFVGNILKRTAEQPGFVAFATRMATKLAMYLAGAAVPFLLWVAYLYLSFWGIEDCTASCTDYAPGWLATIAAALPVVGGSVLVLYFAVGLLLLVVGAFLSANANSLHRLYRDRLSKAFLFDPAKRMAASALLRLSGASGAEADATLRSSDLLPLDGLQLSKLQPEKSPYHLLNTALNIEASKYANRRGRNADFFILSPMFTGSVATGYVDTDQMEEAMTGFTLGTAMAVSGAAASSNMGSSTIKPLVPTLAILNVRLGFWLANPAEVAGALQKAFLWRLFDKFYFLKELFGLLTEDSETVYLTDGGHIENLGMYELLRRRCKMIIAIDAEEDPNMTFGSLVTLERYARIDSGIRIDLPWASIREATLKASAQLVAGGGAAPENVAHGPHCALGTIYYPRESGEKDDRNSTGVLLYVKASFTGDENDYVVDYKRRNPAFPHESTLDQLFTEEQFEAYRALGFHAVHAAFRLTDEVAMSPAPAVWLGANSTYPLEHEMRAALA